MSTTKKWYAVYTKSRWEKKVHRLLQEQQVESYCPLNKVHRKWSDRIKVVQEPLFKSYVFVHINEADKLAVRTINGVVNFVYWLGKPAVIRQDDINRIKRFLHEHENVELEIMDLRPNDRVVITAGALMEREGRVINRLGKKVSIEIESVGFKLIAYVNNTDIMVKRKPLDYRQK